ncbi:3-hydroxyisobutyryl-CoA hydrolase 1-like isoform X1 [Carex littledalei]|uniref:3-hydroxyisobutyryl-CoA hydrolase n=1 Tax=Carex littledalei TaxID=544730 RepID=A0A833QVR0_9POAL|nr:3-hydroxyisobutyryl-CoA hydrolase 1-like isoform X1 [Carex littledalei]
MATQLANGNDADQVLVEEKGFARTLILNRPRQLNALSYTMITLLLKNFKAFEEDPNVKVLILKGKGRAFCAGGDVAAVARVAFLKASLLDGICMGGGAGVSIHGKFRVVTEKTVFAMPETALGVFPDIGASYFLSRLPGYFGEYAGLAGVRLDGSEMLACGLATHFVHSTKLASLEEALAQSATSDPFTVCGIIDQFSQDVPVKETSALNRLEIINKCFSKGTVEEILSALEKEALEVSDKWLHAAIESLKKASPTSLKISLRSIREGRMQTVGECLTREYRMVCHVLRGDFSKDFFEGCRAILFDKDRKPKWTPSKLELIGDRAVDKYFSKIEDSNWEDLKLPLGRRSNAKFISKL